MNCASILAALAFGSLRGVAPAQEPGTPEPWPHETSDLPADLRVKYGALGNGLRWAAVDQAEAPDSRVHLRLFVRVGSLAEEPAELGMAHFVEHMAFNGTKNFAAGTLIDWFQDHGVRFGHDQNAWTGTDETVYELDLPDAETERLERSLQWLRDVADGILFADAEVKAEKGVIDAEERERSGPDMRVYVDLRKKLLGGTRLEQRLPIGTKAARAKFTSKGLRDFHRKWYRPERMALLIAGRLGGIDPEAAITKAFGSLAPRTDALPAMPSAGSAAVASAAFAIHDRESRACQLVVASARPGVIEPDTVASRQAAMLRNAAFGIVNRRLEALARQAGSPLDGAVFGTWDFEGAIEGPALSLHCDPKRWKEAFALAAPELRAALERGFTRDEARTAFDGIHEYCMLEPSVERMPTELFAAKLLAAARGRQVVHEEVGERKLMRPVEQRATAEALHEVLREEWSAGELLIFATGGLDLGKDAEKELRAAWDAAAPAAESDATSLTASAFAYAAKGAAGEVVDQRGDRELKLIQVEFENGVRLTFHPTHEQNPGAAIYVRVGSGYLAAEPDESDVAWVADRVFVAGGLGEHTLGELQQILASARLAFGFDVTFDACVFSGSAAPDGFQRLCETICAFLADPGWREDAFDEFMGNVPRLYESMESGFSGPLARFHAQLHPGDSRFAQPDRELVESFLLDSVKEFLAPQLEEGPIEISIVGGMDPNALIAICARTFGMLPPRGEAPDLSDRLDSPPVASGVKLKAEVETDEKKAHVAIAWPVGDGIDVKRRAELQFLAAALDNRVRVEIREKKGAAYSPRVTHDLSELFPGVGLIRIDVECDPAQAAKVLEACLALGDRLSEDGITQAEFEQVRTIARTQVTQWLDSDGFWLAALSDAWSRPQSLEELRRGAASIDDVTLAAINDLAGAHLARAKASTAVITPKKAAKSK